MILPAETFLALAAVSLGRGQQVPAMALAGVLSVRAGKNPGHGNRANRESGGQHHGGGDLIHSRLLARFNQEENMHGYRTA